MDRRLIEHYEVELAHLRKMAEEFKVAFPRVGERLSIANDPPDPYVERLLEGFSYLAARVQLKMESEFPRFTQGLLETVYPHFVAPTPAMALVRIEPNDSQPPPPTGIPIKRGTELKSIQGPRQFTPCLFTTAQDVMLLPLRIMEARYFTRDLSELGLPASLQVEGGKPKAAIRIRLQATAGQKFHQLNLNELVFYLADPDERAGLLYEQIFGRKGALVVQSATRPVTQFRVLPAASIQQVGFSDKEALLPPDTRVFSGYRLLREYFAFQKRFLFFRLTDLLPAVQQCKTDQIDLVIVLTEEETRLENRVNRDSFSLFCTPAINLFTKSKILLDLKRERSEYPVIPHKQNTIDYEVFQIRSVTGLGTRGTRRFLPFYYTPDKGNDCAAFFTVHRVPRSLTDKERLHGAASDLYRGTDVYLSLVDAECAPYSSDLNELDITALCTNRHLPIGMSVGVGRTDFTCEGVPHVGPIRCLSKTNPQPSAAEGPLAWELISHLSLNYLSLIDTSPEEGAAALRELLKLYGSVRPEQAAGSLDGLKNVQSRPITRRAETDGPLAFLRGLQIKLVFDEKLFGSTEVFLMGAVLEQFFARYVSLNSFTETIVANVQGREIMRWPPQMGKRPLI